MNILWLHDDTNDHQELDEQLKNFEKSIINLTDCQSCMSLLKTSSQENNDRPSILIVLNRTARQIVPEIYSYTTLPFIIIFCTKEDNKIKWARKYSKIKGIFINPKEVIKCLRQIIKTAGLIKPFSCQLVLLDDHPNELIQQQLYRVDSSLLIFQRSDPCVKYFESLADDRPVIFITPNSLARKIVPEIHSNNRLIAVFIYCNDNNEKTKWTIKYNKIKLVTTNSFDLINDVRKEGAYYSSLDWHLVCLNDYCEDALQNRLQEVDPCIILFDRFEICQQYLHSVDKASVLLKPILFITNNRMGRQCIPEIHSNERISAFYVFISSNSVNDQKIKWTTKYNKIKHVCTEIDQLITCIKQDMAILTDKISQNHPSGYNPSTAHTGPVRRSIEHCLVCWLDSNIDETNQDYQRWITQIHKTVSPVRLFTDPDECADFLTNQADEKTSLIVSSTFSQFVVPQIHDIPQLYSIYVFQNTNELKDKGWANHYNKIRGVFNTIEPICQSLKEDVYQLNQDRISISFVPFNSSNKVQLNQLEPLFMYSQLLKEILLELKYDQTSIKEFVSYYRELFVDNNMQLHLINAFEIEYKNKSPIWWYTTESFIYSMLNRALRIFDIAIIIKMGFFICDLHRHIEALYKEQAYDRSSEIFTVYRGQGLSKEDFEQMTKSLGGLISFNSFLSTSLDRTVSLRFAETNQYNPTLITITFQMTIDPSISSTPYAAVKDISRWKQEEEILFSMHTVFRIHQIKYIADRLYEVDLTLTGDNDEDLRVLTEHIRRNIGGDTGFQRLGALMLELGEYDKAVTIYKTLLDSAYSTSDQQKISSMHNQLGAIYSRIGELDAALSHYKKSLEIKLGYLSPSDSSLSAIYSNIGTVFRNQNRFDEALEYMERALKTELDAPQRNPLNIASYHNNIGLVLADQKKYTDARIHYEQALEIQQKYLPHNHPNLATSYNNIGTIYNETCDYHKASSCYEKALEIMQRSLPADHPDLAIPYSNLGAINYELHNYESALRYYEKSIEIMQNSLPSSHPSLILAYQNLALTHQHLGSYTSALQYAEKAVQICCQTFPPSNPQMIACQETVNAIREES